MNRFTFLPLHISCDGRTIDLPGSGITAGSLQLSPELAEVIGVNLGDGGVYQYFAPRHSSYQVAFTASAAEFSYYQDFIKPTIDTTFSVNCRVYLRSDNTTRLQIGSKKIVVFLASLGIPIGKKFDASIPNEIVEQGLIVHFIRGIYHAEGYIYRRYSKMYNRHKKVYSNLLVIQIRMKLRTLMHQIRTELRNLGIIPNRLTEKDGVYTLRITAQDEIRKFFEIIRPRYKLSPHSASL